MADEPSGLPPNLQALLGAYRETKAMPEGARARVHDRLRERASTRTVWLWAGVGALAAGLAVWLGLSATGALQSFQQGVPGSQAPMQAPEHRSTTAVADAPPPREHAAPRRTTSRAVVKVEALEPAPTEDPTTTQAELPATRRRARPTRPPEADAAAQPDPASEVQPPASRLGAENRLIARTWEHVRAEQWARARASLIEHETSFPQGVLTPERRALQVIVDCLATPQDAAGKADAYASSGSTALLSKVRAACSEEKSTPQ